MVVLLNPLVEWAATRSDFTLMAQGAALAGRRWLRLARFVWGRCRRVSKSSLPVEWSLCPDDTGLMLVIKWSDMMPCLAIALAVRCKSLL